MIGVPQDRLPKSVRLLGKAHQQLVQSYPFYTHLVSSWEVYASGAIGTMGVTTVEGSSKLFFNPDFVMQCSAESYWRSCITRSTTSCWVT